MTGVKTLTGSVDHHYGRAAAFDPDIPLVSGMIQVKKFCKTDRCHPQRLLSCTHWPDLHLFFFNWNIVPSFKKLSIINICIRLFRFWASLVAQW